MLFPSAVLLVSLCSHAVNGLAVDYKPVPEAVWKGEGLTQAPPEPLTAAVPGGGAASNVGWTVTVDSSQIGHPAALLLDNGNNRFKTFWHSEYSPVIHYLPHTITIDTKQNRNIQGITYMPRQDGSKNGNIGQHKIYISTDGNNFGDPVAFGTWWDDQTEKSAAWEPKVARYVRIVAITEAGNRGPYTSAAGFSIYTSGAVNNARGIGAWGPTIDFPLVPAAAAVLPDSGNVLTWSSYAYNTFTGTPYGKTLTSTYNPTSRIVTQRMITNTRHDMFCPGISFAADGRVVITGGNDAPKTSLYTGGDQNWQAGSNMYTARAYHSQVTMGDGRLFVIGGSWNGGIGGKNGEIYNPNSNTWYKLPGAKVNAMLTADTRGVFRSDNHAMLFNWKNGYAFQAGPSKQMNWFNTNGGGGQASAGFRGNDNHAMCGTATMYDATLGKILVTGGAPNYDGAAATANAHIITLGNPDTFVNTQNINQMWHRRIFGSSVVLPDGKVFITGGQTVGVAFSDANSIYESELFHPDDFKFTRTMPNSTPRNYHSWSLLMPDATVLVGGGGLCLSCSTNHFDAQVYTPPYLLNAATGGRLGRPVITYVSSRTNRPGSTVTVRTNFAIKSFALIRYGTSTHTVNTDQRRIPINPQNAGTNTYRVTLGPAEYGIVTPGYWMLFALNAAGTPSVAYTIVIQ